MSSARDAPENKPMQTSHNNPYMENFTPTSYTLECVATGREFEDTGWVLSDPQCKTPSLVRAKYALSLIHI